MNLSLDCLVLFLVLLSTKELWNHFNEQSQTGLPDFRRISSLWEVRGVSVSASVACVPIASAKVRRFTAPRKETYEKSGCFCKNRSLFRIPTLQTMRKAAILGDFQGIFRPSRSLTEEKRGETVRKLYYPILKSDNLQVYGWRWSMKWFVSNDNGDNFSWCCLSCRFIWRQQGQLGTTWFFVVNVVLVVLVVVLFFLTTTGTI